MNFRVVFFALALVTLGTSCQEGFLIHISQTPDAPPAMRFESLGIFGSTTVEIRQLSVGRVVAQGKPVELIWQIRTKSGNTERVSELIYGVVPPGFEEVALARPLVVGEVYDILAGGPVGVGGARFTKE